MNKTVADRGFRRRVSLADTLSRDATTGAFLQALAQSARARRQLRFPATTQDIAVGPDAASAVEAA